MNKEQLTEYYCRFRRWQEKGPRYVNRHPDSVQRCHNCGTEFADNFCPRCGQRAGVGRVGWKSIRENIALLWGMDSRSLSYTLFQLLTRPGYLVRDYISGRRQVSFPPVKMLVIVSFFAVIIESVFHLEKEELLPFHVGIPEIDNVVKWFNDNRSWGTLFTNSFSILPTWVVFRFAPRYPRHTLPEGFFLQVFLSVLELLCGFLNYFSASVSSILGIFYTIITYHQLFGYGWWGTLWRFVSVFFAYMMILLPLGMLSYVFSNDDVLSGEDAPKVLLAGAVLLSVMVLSVALILFIPYRISLYKYRKRQSRCPES